ncbi:hypothetical protein JCM3770_003667 [Rhodotorula araucariae]
MLKAVPGLMHEALDAWQTPNGYDVMGVVLFYRLEEKGTLVRKTLVLDFIPMPGGHSAKAMGKLLWDVFEKFDVSERGIWHGKSWIRGFCHVLNLVVLSILSYLTSSPTEFPVAGELDDEELDEEEQWAVLQLEDQDANDEAGPRDDPTRAEVELLAVELDMRISAKAAKRRSARLRAAAGQAAVGLGPLGASAEPEPSEGASAAGSDGEVEGPDPGVEDAGASLTRTGCGNVLKKAAYKRLRYSPEVRRHFAALVAKTGNADTPHSIPQPVQTRWNSMYVTLERINAHVNEVKSLQKTKELNFMLNNRLNKADFKLIHLLVTVLKPFYDHTMQFSTGGSPHVDQVISALDTLTTGLEMFLSDPSIPPALHNALLRGHEKLCEYYELSGDSHTYEVSLVLHLSYGMPYMVAQGWPQDWIVEAVRKAQDWYDRLYREAAKRRMFPDHIKPLSMQKIGHTAFERMLDSTTGADVDFDTLLDHWANTECTRRRPNGKPHDAFDFFVTERAGGREHCGITEMGLDLFSAVGNG